jgi:hypothetical protein
LKKTFEIKRKNEINIEEEKEEKPQKIEPKYFEAINTIPVEKITPKNVEPTKPPQKLKPSLTARKSAKLIQSSLSQSIQNLP